MGQGIWGGLRGDGDGDGGMLVEAGLTDVDGEGAKGNTWYSVQDGRFLARTYEV